MTISTTPASPTIAELEAQRAAITNKIEQKKSRIVTETQALEKNFGADFVRDVEAEVLKLVKTVASLAEFDQNESCVMAKGVDSGSSPISFLAFRIELLTNEQEKICTVVLKVFKTLSINDETKYFYPKHVQGSNGNFYPSPILSVKGEKERRHILRDLINGRKFIWDAVALKKDVQSGYQEADGALKVHYFRKLQLSKKS